MRVGVDVGGSLTKVAVVSGEDRQFRLLEHTDAGRVAEALPLGVPIHATGCGATELLERLGSRVTVLDELECFCVGARQLVREHGMRHHSFVLTSMGTGTSVFYVAGETDTKLGRTVLGDGGELGARADTRSDVKADLKATTELSDNAGSGADAKVGARVTGTGVGGGTIMGLGSLLLSTGDFAEIMRLAAMGRRQRVDLMVSDLYRDSAESPVLSALTAANFGRGGCGGAENADVASAIVQLVVEVVAVLSIQVARAYRDPTIVLAGSPMSHAHIRERFVEIGRHLGHQFAFLENGAFCGALGAILLSDVGSRLLP